MSKTSDFSEAIAAQISGNLATRDVVATLMERFASAIREECSGRSSLNVLLLCREHATFFSNTEIQRRGSKIPFQDPNCCDFMEFARMQALR